MPLNTDRCVASNLHLAFGILLNMNTTLPTKRMALPCHIVAGHDFVFNQPLCEGSIQTASDRIF